MAKAHETGCLNFVAGSTKDPRPAGNPLLKRFGRCLNCNRIVHFSVDLLKWVYDDGTFHTAHVVEFPVDWLSANALIQLGISLDRGEHKDV